jgi:hypothetical protein
VYNVYTNQGDNILIHYSASHPQIAEILNNKSNYLEPCYLRYDKRAGLSKFVYIINFGADYYKIGITHRPSQRLRSFQSSNPFVTGSDSVISLLVYADAEKREKDAQEIGGGLLRPSLFSKSKNPRSYANTNGRYPGPYSLLRQLERAIHAWCIERGLALDEVRKGNKITTEIFKLNPLELGDLIEAVNSWGFASIPREAFEIGDFIVPASSGFSNQHTILERQIS